MDSLTPKGRGTALQPPNRFENSWVATDYEQVEDPAELAAEAGLAPAEYLPDASRSIISENDSPDVFFRYSLNPYRGCSHGCSYCYARPSHEYLGLNAGIDFETKILVKHDAARLLRAFLARPKWQPEEIVLSGVTDPYQPAERELRITRQCLEVLAAARQPIGVITKNALIVRDLDLLASLAEVHAVHANLSITTLDADLARAMEPRTSTPAARLRAVRALADAGVPVRVMVAPIIPGLNDHEAPAILAAAAEAGATSAGYLILRLPGAVEPVFREWLARTHPLARERVEGYLRTVRGGRLSDPRWGTRMKGEGERAEQIAQMFQVFKRKHGLDRPPPPLDASHFTPPPGDDGQRSLF